MTEMSDTTFATHHRTVGDECLFIIRLSVNAGLPAGWKGKGYYPKYPSGDLAEWWKENSHLPLWKIQLVAVEEELTSWRKDLTQASSDRQPEIKEMIHYLEASESKLRKNREPLPAKFPRQRMLRKGY